MSKLILPKATSAQREAATPVEGDLLYDVDKKALYFGDGAHQGGVALGVAHDDPFVYGIDYDTSIATASAACQKVVLNHSHDQAGDALRYTVVDDFTVMPAHNFRRCVMDDLANRHVNYYLNASDSTKKEDGTAAVLTGADGDVMVEIPVTYYRIDHYTDSSDNEHTVWLVSDKPFTGSAIHRFFYVSPGGATARAQYVGAFRDVLCDASGAPKAQVDDDTPAEYVAGDKFRSIAGARPAGNISRIDFRAGSVVNGGTNANAMFFQYLIMMMTIEAGTFDHKTGISVGYTQLKAQVYAALRKTGRTAALGNGTGEILADETEGGADVDLLTMNDGATIWKSAATHKVVQFAYRGIEDPFGSQRSHADGINKNQSDDPDDFTKSGFWCTNDTQKYANCDTGLAAGSPGGTFPAVGYTGANVVWVSHAFPKELHWGKDFDPRTFFSLSSGGSTGTYLCGFMNNGTSAGARGVIYGVECGPNDHTNTSVVIDYFTNRKSIVMGCRISC